MTPSPQDFTDSVSTSNEWRGRSKQSSDLTTFKILLIDDDEDDFIITRALLADVKHHHFQLDWISEYDEAFEEICANRHDAYLLDYRLGERNGLDLLRSVIETGCTAPIVFLTGYGNPEIDVKAMEAGASAYLVKGNLTPELLERTIRYAITHTQLERELAEARECLVKSSENEQFQLAQKMHEGPVQVLYGIRFRLTALSKSVEDNEHVAKIEDIQTELQQVTQTLRTMCSRLYSPTLIHFGLTYAIRSHAEEFQETHPKVDVALDLESDEQRVPDNVRQTLLHVYQYYQQLLANTLQPGAPCSVRVRLALETNAVILEMEDNGCSTNGMSQRSRLMRQNQLRLSEGVSTLASLGGKMQIRSTSDASMLVHASAPIPRAE